MRVRGLLLDLEGVLYQGGAPIRGAADAVRGLHHAGLPITYLTNTTTKPRSAIVDSLLEMGFPADPPQVLTPAATAARVLRREHVQRVHLAAAGTLAEDLEGFELVDEDPQAVVLGDLHRGFDWDTLDGLFGMLREGARLVALHKNRFCRRGDELGLDLGPFVAALEYAAETEALVAGKPSAAFFEEGLRALELHADDVVMVGDDAVSDIAGARAVGIRAVQVRTGKYRPGAGDEGGVDAVIDSIAELPEMLQRQ